MSRIVLAVLALSLTGCGGWQSVVDPAGPQSGRVNSLWWFLFSLLAAIYLLVLAATFFGAFRSRRTHTEPGAEGRFRRNVIGASVLTAVILIVLIAVSVATGRANSTSLASKCALVIEVVGNQWWWQIRYPDYQNASNYVTTANEIHIPVGRPVMLRLSANDVIHSLWIPNLNGKTDLIPSRVTTTWIQADRPGVFRGQCAEYCGLQHAHMALLVIAEPPADFARWLAHERQNAVEPADPVKQRGRQVFLAAPCVMCHTIRGIGAFGATGPDLTHLASRRTIAAGTLPNTIGNLGGWIADSQSVKPGNRMPPISIPPEDLQPLLTYLESLR
jgi:cytochrome c oxidase subunit 2